MKSALQAARPAASRRRSGQRPAAWRAQPGGKILAGLSARSRYCATTHRTTCTRLPTPSLRCKRSRCVWTVWGEMCSSEARACSVRLSNTPRTISSSRPDKRRLRAVSAHCASLSKAEPARRSRIPSCVGGSPPRVDRIECALISNLVGVFQADQPWNLIVPGPVAVCTGPGCLNTGDYRSRAEGSQRRVQQVQQAQQAQRCRGRARTPAPGGRSGEALLTAMNDSGGDGDDAMELEYANPLPAADRD
jgi:hypothetical protein